MWRGVLGSAMGSAFMPTARRGPARHVSQGGRGEGKEGNPPPRGKQSYTVTA